MAECIRQLERLLASGGKHQVVCLTVNSIIAARKDKVLRPTYSEASLVLPDGIAVLWASRLLGQPIPGRVAGPDLLPAVSKMAAHNRLSFYLLGGARGVPERLAEILIAANPGLRVVGTCSPPVQERFSNAVNARIIDRINAVKPDILWVGLGSPKQDKWIHDHLNRLSVRVAIGVGAAFDICSGRLRGRPCGCRKAAWNGFSGS